MAASLILELYRHRKCALAFRGISFRQNPVIWTRAITQNFMAQIAYLRGRKTTVRALRARP